MIKKTGAGFPAIMTLILTGMACADTRNFEVTLSDGDHNHKGSMALSRDIREGIRYTTFDYDFDGSWPDTGLVRQEQIEEINGLALTRTDPPREKSGSKDIVSVSEYGTFSDLCELIEQIVSHYGDWAFWRDAQQATAWKKLEDGSLAVTLPDDGREYRVPALLIDKPVAIVSAWYSVTDKGNLLTLTFSGGEEAMFRLTGDGDIEQMTLVRGDWQGVYQAKKSAESVAALN